ncbi:deoxynucleoside kinase [Candidatus Woesearchaeota archaeon]|nr:deoxynucleoside kinase [Candidatus Woesearchaeota archaeon]
MNAKEKLQHCLERTPTIITVAGNIGLGKSTLAELISQDLEIPGSYELDNRVMNVDLLMRFIKAPFEEKAQHCYNLEVDLCNRRVDARRTRALRGQSFIEDRTPEEDPAVLHPHLANLGYLNREQYDDLQQLWKSQAGKTPRSGIMLLLHASAEVARAGIERRGREGELDAWQLERDLRPLKELYDVFPERVPQYGLHQGPIILIDREVTDTLNPQHRERIYRSIMEALGNKP